MPVYNYKCEECSLQIDEIKKIEDRDIIDYELCPKLIRSDECQMKRKVSEPTNPVFKGTGFYSTDY
jgi:putative FmdB family regulatory protein